MDKNDFFANFREQFEDTLPDCNKSELGMTL